jgi:hypothetical protein
LPCSQHLWWHKPRSSVVISFTLLGNPRIRRVYYSNVKSLAFFFEDFLGSSSGHYRIQSFEVMIQGRIAGQFLRPYTLSWSMRSLFSNYSSNATTSALSIQPSRAVNSSHTNIRVSRLDRREKHFYLRWGAAHMLPALRFPGGYYPYSLGKGSNPILREPSTRSFVNSGEMQRKRMICTFSVSSLLVH